MWQLREIEFHTTHQSESPVEKGRDGVADIEYQPDRKKGSHTVKIGLAKNAKEVAIEQSHRVIVDLGFGSQDDMVSSVLAAKPQL